MCQVMRASGEGVGFRLGVGIDGSKGARRHCLPGYENTARPLRPSAIAGQVQGRHWQRRMAHRLGIRQFLLVYF